MRAGHIDDDCGNGSALDSRRNPALAALHAVHPLCRSGRADRAVLSIGSVELTGVWTDPDFDRAANAFYYVRTVDSSRAMYRCA